MPLLNVTLVPAPDQVVVRVSGDADLSTASMIADALSQSAGLGTRQVGVDVAGTHFWDCSGLHALREFTAELAAEGRSCRIVGAPARTRRLISAAGLDDRLELDGPLTWPAPVRADGEPNWAWAPAPRAGSGHPVPLRPRRVAPVPALRRG